MYVEDVTQVAPHLSTLENMYRERRYLTSSTEGNWKQEKYWFKIFIKFEFSISNYSSRLSDAKSCHIVLETSL
jgi:hypothetical protein